MDRGNSQTLRLIAGSVADAARGMENTAFEADADKSSMELRDVKVADGGGGGGGGGHSCEPDVCRALHAQYLQERTKMAANPWDRLKTVFLVAIIALLALWVVVYVALSRMGLV